MWVVILQRITLEFVLDFFYFPVWWYTAGAKRALLFCVSLVQDGNNLLAPGLWLRNIFVPMFGQWDWQGRLVSVFMRLANVIGRSFALLIWLAAVSVLFLVWIAWPVFVVVMLFRSI